MLIRTNNISGNDTADMCYVCYHLKQNNSVMDMQVVLSHSSEHEHPKGVDKDCVILIFQHITGGVLLIVSI